MSTAVSGLRTPAQHLKTLAWQAALFGGAVLSEMSFLEHLEELRKRIIKSLVALAVATLGCFMYSAELIRFLSAPAERVGAKLVAIQATEIFSLYFRVALAGGICLSAPFILWQVWRFIEPGLYPHERRYAGPFLASTTICFAGGALFGYLVVAPWFLQLEMDLGSAAGIEVTMSASSYFNLLTALVVTMGGIFEMPPVIFILSRIGLVSAGFLLRNLKYAVLIFAVAAAVLTPSTDIAQMLAFMAMMTAMYLLSILVAFVFGKKRETARD